MYFWKTPFQRGNVSLKPRVVKPAKHLVKFLSENYAHHRQRKFLKFHPFPEYPAKNLCRLNVSQVAACNLQFHSDEVLWPVQGQRAKSADVVNRDGLVGFIGPDRIGQRSFDNS